MQKCVPSGKREAKIRRKNQFPKYKRKKRKTLFGRLQNNRLSVFQGTKHWREILARSAGATHTLNSSRPFVWSLARSWPTQNKARAVLKSTWLVAFRDTTENFRLYTVKGYEDFRSSPKGPGKASKDWLQSPEAEVSHNNGKNRCQGFTLCRGYLPSCFSV